MPTHGLQSIFKSKMLYTPTRKPAWEYEQIRPANGSLRASLACRISLRSCEEYRAMRQAGCLERSVDEPGKTL